MSRPAGLPKTGGRQKGTPNRKTLDLSEAISASGLSLPDRLMELLPSLEPEREAQVILKLMEFIYPKKRAVEVKETPRDTHDMIMELIQKQSL